MTSNYWDSLQKRDISLDDVNQQVAEQPEDADWSDPNTTAQLFVLGLSDPAKYFEALASVITPESRPRWGDFQVAARKLEAIPDWGLGDSPTPAVGDPTVVYAKILPHVEESFLVTLDQHVNVAAVLTLVWRTKLGMWRVHDFGDYVKPEFVPHG